MLGTVDIKTAEMTSSLIGILCVRNFFLNIARDRKQNSGSQCLREGKWVHSECTQGLCKRNREAGGVDGEAAYVSSTMDALSVAAGGWSVANAMSI